MADIEKAPKWLWTALLVFVGLLVIGGLINLIPAPTEKTAKPAAPKIEQPKSKIAELACATVIVPAGEIVNTHFLHRPRERIKFNVVSGGSSNPEKPFYYVHGDNNFNLPVYRENFSCEYPVTDTVRLKGGTVTVIVKLSK